MDGPRPRGYGRRHGTPRGHRNPMPLLHRSEPAPASSSLEPIRIATDELELIGSVAPTGQRITDLLLRGQDLAFLPAGADPTPDAWISIAPTEVLWVVPPPLPDRRDWRPTASRTRIFVQIDGHRIIGAAHLAPEAASAAAIAARHPFLPLTDASLATDGEPTPEDLAVVIVNLARAADVRQIG
jgi:hypothetical protein